MNTSKPSIKYENMCGNVYTFTKQEDGNVLWEGDFDYCGVSHSYINPSGGPFIKVGQMLSHIVYDEAFNVIVEGFERVETGYLIKTKEHIVDPETEKLMFEDRNIIGGII